MRGQLFDTPNLLLANVCTSPGAGVEGIQLTDSFRSFSVTHAFKASIRFGRKQSAKAERDELEILTYFESESLVPLPEICSVASAVRN